MTYDNVRNGSKPSRPTVLSLDNDLLIHNNTFTQTEKSKLDETNLDLSDGLLKLWNEATILYH